MFSIWGKPWWFPHVTAICMTLIVFVIAFIIYCLLDKHNKKALRLQQQRKRARKTYQGYYTIKIRGRKNVGQVNENQKDL